MKNKFQHKLYNYEVNPPENAWEKIAASLDESHLAETFPARLYNLERTPPAGTWGKITNKLSGEHDAALPVKRNFSPIFRYAAAAVFIGLITITAIWLINYSNNEEQVAHNENNITNKDSATDKPIENTTIQDPATVDPQQARDDAALEASKQIFAKLDVPAKKRIMALNPEFLTMPVEITRTMNILYPEETYRDIYYSSINSSIHIESDKYNIADRYIMLMTPEGNIIRVAKKWGDLLCCVTGEEQDEFCKDQLRKWRMKIASAPVAPSPGNFLDILNLVNSLKENLP